MPLHALHLHQYLVYQVGLPRFSPVPPGPSERIEVVEEDHRPLVLPGGLEQHSDVLLAGAHEAVPDVGGFDAVELRVYLRRHRPRKHGLPGTRGAVKQHPGAGFQIESVEQVRMLSGEDHVAVDLLLRLIQSRDLVETGPRHVHGTEAVRFVLGVLPVYQYGFGLVLLEGMLQRRQDVQELVLPVLRAAEDPPPYRYAVIISPYELERQFAAEVPVDVQFLRPASLSERILRYLLEGIVEVYRIHQGAFGHAVRCKHFHTPQLYEVPSRSRGHEDQFPRVLGVQVATHRAEALVGAVHVYVGQPYASEECLPGDR